MSSAQPGVMGWDSGDRQSLERREQIRVVVANYYDLFGFVSFRFTSDLRIEPDYQELELGRWMDGWAAPVMGVLSKRTSQENRQTSPQQRKSKRTARLNSTWRRGMTCVYSWSYRENARAPKTLRRRGECQMLLLRGYGRGEESIEINYWCYRIIFFIPMPAAHPLLLESNIGSGVSPLGV